MQSAKRDLPVIAFEAQETWRAWLAANSKTSKGLWLKLAKKSSGIPSVSKQEAIEAAATVSAYVQPATAWSY